MRDSEIVREVAAFPVCIDVFTVELFDMASGLAERREVEALEPAETMLLLADDSLSAESGVAERKPSHAVRPDAAAEFAVTGTLAS